MAWSPSPARSMSFSLYSVGTEWLLSEDGEADVVGLRLASSADPPAPLDVSPFEGVGTLSSSGSAGSHGGSEVSRCRAWSDGASRRLVRDVVAPSVS